MTIATRHLLPLTVVLAVLAGCANRSAEIVHSLPPGHRVAVLSLMPDAMIVRTQGTMPWADNAYEISLPDWDVNAHLEQMAANAVSGTGRMSVASVATPEVRSRFGTADWSVWDGDPVVNGGYSALANYAQSVDASLLLLIAPGAVSGEFFLGGGQYAAHSGYGIYQKDTLLTSPSAKYFAVLQVVMLDAATGRQFADTMQYDSAPAAYGQWLEESRPLTIEQQDRIRADLLRVVEETLSDALTDLALQ